MATQHSEGDMKGTAGVFGTPYVYGRESEPERDRVDKTLKTPDQAAPARTADQLRTVTATSEWTRCGTCHHGWQSHSFVGKRGGTAASIKCQVPVRTKGANRKTCPCEIRLPSEVVQSQRQDFYDADGHRVDSKVTVEPHVIANEGGEPSQVMGA